MMGAMSLALCGCCKANCKECAENCRSEMMDCALDKECKKVMNCYTDEDKDLDKCKDKASPAGKNTFEPLYQCLKANCASFCL